MATAEATAAREARARKEAEARLVATEQELQRLRSTVEEMRDQITAAQVPSYLIIFI